MAETSKKRRKTCLGSYWKEIKSARLNRPVILLLIYSIPISLTLTIGQGVTYGMFTHPEGPTCFSPMPLIELQDRYTAWLIQGVYLYVSHPIAGWLADTKIGRGIAIHASLWLCWVGVLLLCVSYSIQYAFCGLWDSIARYLISGIALLLLMFGIADFHANVLAYGMDQMPDASNAQIRSFIRWFTWTLFVGFSVDFVSILHESVGNHDIVLGLILVTFVLLSIALCLHGWFQQSFLYSGTVKRNPYKTIHQVLSYAWHHKSPENRSALTYWEEKIPSRIDLAKEKYGGPFLEEAVEDVKSFWRVVAVFSALGGLFIPYFLLVDQPRIIGDQFTYGKNDVDGYGPYILWRVTSALPLFVIPILDLVVIPMFPKIEYFILSPIRGLASAYVSVVLAVFLMMLLHLIGITTLSRGDDCSFSSNRMDSIFNMSYLYFTIPCIFVGIFLLLSFMEAFEFICSQAPLGMSGMLTGIFWFIRAIYISIGTLVLFPFTYLQTNVGNIPCTFWVLLLLMVTSVSGFVFFIIIIKWYHRRQKSTQLNTQYVIESHYSKYLRSHTFTVNTTPDEFVFPLPGWSDNVVPVQPQ